MAESVISIVFDVMESFNCLSSPVMIEGSSKASDRKYEERIQILFELTFITFIFVFDARFTRKDRKKVRSAKFGIDTGIIVYIIIFIKLIRRRKT